MKKITKDVENIPPSLNSNRTKERRNELINNGGWMNDKVYQNRYKQTDIRKELNKIYFDKCVYCERRDEELQVEHFRPKSIYFWLAYSWDNLMLCCSKCNKIKNDIFDVKSRATIDSLDITDIHHLTEKYNFIEKNQLVNPELEDVTEQVEFTKEGEMKSADERVNKTIEVCQLNRKKLIEFRKPIYDTFEKEIISRKNEREELKRRIKEFIYETNQPRTEFYLFRNYIYKKLLKEVLQNGEQKVGIS